MCWQGEILSIKCRETLGPEDFVAVFPESNFSGVRRCISDHNRYFDFFNGILLYCSTDQIWLEITSHEWWVMARWFNSSSAVDVRSIIFVIIVAICLGTWRLFKQVDGFTCIESMEYFKSIIHFIDMIFISQIILISSIVKDIFFLLTKFLEKFNIFKVKIHSRIIAAAAYTDRTVSGGGHGGWIWVLVYFGKIILNEYLDEIRKLCGEYIRGRHGRDVGECILVHLAYI